MMQSIESTGHLAVSLSLAELYALASLLGGELLIGIPAPFAGWLTEEIQEAVQTAHHTLVERQYLRLQEDKLLIDAAVAAVVGAIVEPQAVCLITTAIPGQPPRQANSYYRPPLTVFLEPTSDPVILQALPTPEAILERSLSLWEIAAQKPAPATPFSIPESVLLSARETRPDREVSRQLEESGIPSTGAAALADTLTALRRNGALVVIRRRRETWDVDGIAMLEGENGLWLLRPSIRQQAHWVECIPCSGERLRDEVERLIWSLLPPEER